MDKKEEGISTEKKIDFQTNMYKLATEEVEFTMNFKKMKNPGDLLEKLYILRENQSLSSAEKNEVVKKIMLDYMGWFFWKISDILYYLICQIRPIQSNVQIPIYPNIIFFVILGLEYLNPINTAEKIPIALNIDKDGNLSINGLDEDKLNDDNIYIYTDKKVTTSD